MFKRIFPSFFLLCIVFAGCKKESPSNNSGVPNTYVNFPVNVDGTGYSNLLTVGGWVYTINDGYNYNGILLFCNGQGSYLAFDRSCPYDCQTNSKAVIQVETNGITAKCPVCGTTYNLYSGVYTSSTGGIALKQYYINYDNYPPTFVVSSSPQ